MKKYRRDITLKLWLLRIAGGLAVLSSLLLINTVHADYGWVLLFIILCGAIFPITELIISHGILGICQYHVYGFLPRTWEFRNTDRVRLQPFDLVLTDGSPAYTDDWYDAFLIFAPYAEVKISKFVLKYQKVTGEEGQIKLKLYSKEIDLLRTNLSIEQQCP
jgi:hypothetical protein